jgi:predicted SAM-dependent methyltransferase
MSVTEVKRQSASPLKVLKRAIVGAIGRDRANRLGAPFYDWSAGRRTARTLSSLPKSDLCLNIGCGSRPLPGWVNLDAARGDQIDVVWDLRRGLPFPDDSCAAIFGEHVIEHIPKADAESLLRECHRVLQPDGVVRLSTPDAGKFLRAYVGDKQFLADPRFPDSADTSMDRVNMMMREYGQHLWVYDIESICLVLQKAGFSSTIEQKFGASTHPGMQGIDLEERAFESLYVEAVK